MHKQKTNEAQNLQRESERRYDLFLEHGENVKKCDEIGDKKEKEIMEF